MLKKRKQLPDEHTVSYINDAESLCRRIDSKMSQEEMVRNIMKGLKPSIARYIGIMGNQNLTELKSNVRKYEMVEFMITGDTPKTSLDFETEIIKSKLQQINSNKIAKVDEIDKLREEINSLKITFDQLRNNEQNKQHQNNIERNNPNTFNNKQNQNKFNNQHWRTQEPQTYNTSYNNTPYNWNTNPTQHNQLYPPLNPMNNASQINYPPHNYRSFNIQKKKCSICSKTNHSEDKCFFKNKPRPSVCQICNKFGHTANNCDLYLNKSKN